MYKKKLTNMIWLSMRESVLYSLLLIGIALYWLEHNNMIEMFGSWREAARISMSAIGVAVTLGAAFGYWQSNKIKRRLEMLREAMLLLEKGNLAHSLPILGEDEVGRLGDQLSRIGEKWQEQVTSLQRLSTHNAELTEKARYSAVIEERQRLARELHDAVSQQLFAISMTATALGRTLEKDFDKAKRQVTLIEEMASVAQSEMRALLLHLRPVHLEGKRLTEGLMELFHELKQKVPIDIRWEMEDELRMPKGIEDHLFRIVQEALSNALRHSQATELDVKLHGSEHHVRLTLYDNGVGFDLEVQKQTSYGIVSMRERVNEVGGSMNLVTAPGKGTRIDIRVPLMAAEVAESH